MKKLLSFTLSLIIMSSFLCQGAFAIKDTGELVSGGCALCDSDYGFISNPDASTAKTYEAYYGVETISGLTSDTSAVYYDSVSGGYICPIYLTRYNGKTICLPCLEKKVNEYKAANDNTQKVDENGAADIPITVTREAATFSVTVPTSLPVTVAADGTVTVADNATIENNGSGAVCVKNVKVTASENWALASFDKSAMLKEAPGTKKVGLSITMGSKTAATSATGQSEDIGSYDNTDITIAAGNKLEVTYDATIPAQPNGLAQEQAASVVFTIDWAS